MATASYDTEAASRCAALGIPTFACTPDQFPDLMAAALRRDDIAAWAADSDIKLALAARFSGGPAAAGARP